jgi:hypothetical protein
MALFPLSLEFRRTGTKPAEGLGERRVAYGKTVWSWRPDAGVKFAKGSFRGRRWQESPVTGESTV